MLEPTEIGFQVCRGGLLAQELVHVAQWRRAGRRAPPGLRWAVFPIRYVGSYLRARLRGVDRTSAYRAIPYEREARRFERRFECRLNEQALSRGATTEHRR